MPNRLEAAQKQNNPSKPDGMEGSKKQCTFRDYYPFSLEILYIGGWFNLKF